VGISATPFKFGGSDRTQKYAVKGYFGPIMKVKSAGETGILTTAELQRRNILPPARCIFYPIREPQLPYAVYQDAVTLGIAENWHFHKIVTRLAASLQGRTLILVDRLAHGDYLESLIPGALWVRGKDDQDTREFVIDKLKKSKENTVAIATQGIFNAGIDVFVHNLINAASGQADHQIVQRIGRGLRAAPDKDMLNYFDFVFEINDYLLSHSKKRIKILTDEKHEVIVKNEIDF
jgi:superfamily II DNA or RNA helicase